MTKKEAREIFDRIWKVERRIYDGFPITAKLEGRKITVLICGGVLYESGEGFYANFDEYDVVPACPDSKWLGNIGVDLVDRQIFDEKMVPKDIQKEVQNLQKSLKNHKDVIQPYVDTVFMGNSIGKNFGDFWKLLQKNEEKARIKASIKNFKLNDAYTAIFHDDQDTVQVGCQTFSKKVIKKLAEQL